MYLTITAVISSWWHYCGWMQFSYFDMRKMCVNKSEDLSTVSNHNLKKIVTPIQV